MSALDEVVGMRIRHCRWKAGLRQEDIATRLGISLQQVRRYESGESRISASRLFDLAGIFDVPISHFFAGLPPGSPTDHDRGEGGAAGDLDPALPAAVDDSAAKGAEGGQPGPLPDDGAGPEQAAVAEGAIGRGRGAGRLAISYTALDRATLQKRLLQYVDCLPQQELEAIMAMLQAMAEARGCRADLH